MRRETEGEGRTYRGRPQRLGVGRWTRLGSGGERTEGVSKHGVGQVDGKWKGEEGTCRKLRRPEQEADGGGDMAERGNMVGMMENGRDQD